LPFGNPVRIRYTSAVATLPAAPSTTTAFSKLPRPLAGSNGSVARTAESAPRLLEAPLELAGRLQIRGWDTPTPAKLRFIDRSFTSGFAN
jgi:hypothetical protein